MRGSGGDVTKGFLFDVGRCTGCRACELACSTENELGWGQSWRQVVPFNEERRPGIPTFHLSLACNHCDDAPCMSQCPSLAISRESSTGAVLIDAESCIGCRYCSWVCPYDAMRFDDRLSVMTKCTSCNHRLKEGLEPACVDACPTAALGFGALEGEEDTPGFPKTPAGPRIRFQPLKEGARPAESTWSLGEDVIASFVRSRPEWVEGITLRSELPLWLFTTAAAALVGWVLAAAAGQVEVNALLFAPLAAMTLAVSTFHLGRPLRAWRAVLNLRRSRLSREIAAFGAFLGATALTFLWVDPPAALGWVAAGAGLLALFSIDRVYDPVRTSESVPIHSADVLLTGPLFATALLEVPSAFGVLAVIKLVLYVRGKFQNEYGLESAPRSLLAAARVGFGLILPPVLWWFWPEAWAGWGLLSLGVGELVDRGEFYEGLEISTPRTQAYRDARAWGKAG
jgi:DMSO reductase iron-sulfur subunit